MRAGGLFNKYSLTSTKAENMAGTAGRKGRSLSCISLAPFPALMLSAHCKDNDGDCGEEEEEGDEHGEGEEV